MSHPYRLIRFPLLVFALVAASACGGSDDGPTGDGSFAVGAACTSDSDCAGPGVPRCISGLYPLADLSADRALQEIGVPFPGGYCSSEPSCTGADSCGPGGRCFQPLADVSEQTLQELQPALLDVDVHVFATYGACLDPCTTNSECRDGYVCAVPLGPLLSVVDGAREETYCIGASVEAGCGVCDANATCDPAMGEFGLCVCNDGYAGDGDTCTLIAAMVDECALGTDDCSPNATCTDAANGFTCACNDGYVGNGVTCDAVVLVDECTLGTDDCAANATCTDTPSSFTCACNTNFAGNGTTCAACQNGGTAAAGSAVCSCPSGFGGTYCETAGATPGFCDVVYRLDTAAPSAASQFRVVKTGTGAMDALNTVGTNASLPNTLTAPFTSAAFPRGFMRLRYQASNNAPIAGSVQLVEYYMPMEFTSGITGATVTTNVDHSVGLLSLTTTGCAAGQSACPVQTGTTQTLGRTCAANATGAVAGTTLTWGTCSLTPPTPPTASNQTPVWTYANSQLAAANEAANPGCAINMVAWGNVTCAGGLCFAVPAATLGIQKSSWDQRLQNFVYSSNNYATATIQMPQTTVPDGMDDVYSSIRFQTATPVSTECHATAAEMTCNEQ